ncbi:MAG TPA: hypothetical protein PKV98_01415 [Burkholderiaceae bacterium]|nr:hypothetical protein [Burkholderiaceae bacterium]
MAARLWPLAKDGAHRRRGARIFAAHYVGPSRGGYIGIAAQVGLTRERIRVLMGRLLRAARSSPLQAPVALERLEALRAALPLPIELLQERLAPQLGRGCDVEDLLRFVEQVLQAKTDVRRQNIWFGGRNTTILHDATDRAPWPGLALRLARAHVERLGSAHPELIAGALAQHYDRHPPAADLIATLRLHPGFTPLVHGWFTLSETETWIDIKVRKLFAAGAVQVPIDDLMSAIASDWRYVGAQDKPPPMLPHHHVVIALLRTRPWISLNHRYAITLRDPAAIDGALTAVEQAMVARLQECSGVTAARDLVRSGAASGRTAAAARMALALSPVFVPLGQQLYALRAQRIDPLALAKATKARRRNS